MQAPNRRTNSVSEAVGPRPIPFQGRFARAWPTALLYLLWYEVGQSPKQLLARNGYSVARPSNSNESVPFGRCQQLSYG